MKAPRKEERRYPRMAEANKAFAISSGDRVTLKYR
jgi:hypothetical protein